MNTFVDFMLLHKINKKNHIILLPNTKINADIWSETDLSKIWIKMEEYSYNISTFRMQNVGQFNRALVCVAKNKTWWNMMKSSNGNIFRVTGLLWGEFTGHRPVTRSFHVFFYLRPNDRLDKQSWGWWFETPSCSLWCHSNVCFEIQTISFKSVSKCRPLYSTLCVS